MKYSIEIKLIGQDEWLDYIPCSSSKEHINAVAAILRANTAIADVRIVTWYHQDILKNELTEMLKNVTASDIALAVGEVEDSK